MYMYNSPAPCPRRGAAERRAVQRGREREQVALRTAEGALGTKHKRHKLSSPL